MLISVIERKYLQNILKSGLWHPLSSNSEADLEHAQRSMGCLLLRALSENNIFNPCPKQLTGWKVVKRDFQPRKVCCVI